MTARGSSSRHRGRELALQTLYAVDLGIRRAHAGAGETVRNLELGAPAEQVAETLAAAAAEADAPRSGTPAADSSPVAEAIVRSVFDAIAANFEAPPGARDFAWALVSEVCENVVGLDEQIGKKARNWRVSRMAAVDRNILRLGAHELAHTDTPPAVVIDEAVELARRYGTDASPGFVNGILDALAGGSA